MVDNPADALLGASEDSNSSAAPPKSKTTKDIGVKKAFGYMTSKLSKDTKAKGKTRKS